MKLKVMAIGSKVMGDDGIAVYIAEDLKKMIKNNDVEIIIGETDFGYCLDSIEPEDMIIVLDSSCIGGEPGTVRRIPYEKFLKLQQGAVSSQHEISFLRQLNFYHDVKKITLIAIEANDIGIGYGLSEAMKSRFSGVLKEVFGLIQAELYPP